jgi:hypothetical protein
MPLDDTFQDFSIDKEWLNPLSMLELQDAVHKAKDTVVLNGRHFTIRYVDASVDDHGIMTGKVFVRIVGNYAPCGWFGIQDLLNYEFESDHDKHL